MGTWEQVRPVDGRLLPASPFPSLRGKGKSGCSDFVITTEDADNKPDEYLPRFGRRLEVRSLSICLTPGRSSAGVGRMASRKRDGLLTVIRSGKPGTSRPLEVSGPSGFPFIIGCPYENRQFMKPVGNTSFLRLFQGPTGGCPTLATRRPGAIDRLLPILLRF